MSAPHVVGEQGPDISLATKPKMVILIDNRESVALSWARDAVSFGGLFACAYGLNVLMPPSGWLNAALGISWILWLAGKATSRSKQMTFDEIREWVADHDTRPTAKAGVV